jgi:hypothetical protein
MSKARSKQCSDFEEKRGESELSIELNTVNSNFQDPAALSTVDSDVESSFEAVQ